MPIYEYQCSNCAAELNKLQKINDKPLKLCPECKKNTLTKKLSSGGFVLKGSGWYVTDFKDKKPGASTASVASTSGNTNGAAQDTSSTPSSAATASPAEKSSDKAANTISGKTSEKPSEKSTGASSPSA